MKNHGQKQLGEERVYFILPILGNTLSLREVREESQDRMLEAGTSTQVF